MMDFRNFLRPYMQDAYLIEREEGHYDGGEWIPGKEVKVHFRATITIFSDDFMQFGEAGTYTEDDRKVFTYKELKRGQKIEIADERYTITAERAYDFYARGLRMYIVEKDGESDD